MQRLEPMRASAKAEGATVIILVDFENTHASGLEGYTYLNESDTLVMYYSDENSAVTKGVVDDLRKNGVHVRLVKLLKQHSNALDMYIASTTGMFLDSGEKICIVSKDHGYAAVRDFWHSLRGAEILLGETIKQCLLSSELNDEARIRLCKEREQKAMLVDAFTTMNTIPTRPTLSRSNQRRRRNDTRNFMEVSEPVAILPNPLMTETPADQLAKELSSAVAKSENAVPAAQQETAMTTSVSSDNVSATAPVTEAEASTTAGRGERGGRGRNGRNRRNDQNHRNERNDRPERDDRNAQDRTDTTAAEKTGSDQHTGRDADAQTQNARSTREQSSNRREQNSTAEQNTTSEPAQERFGGYDGIMKMNEASRIALDKRQEREEQKAEQDEPSAAKNRNHPKQNAQTGTALTQAKQETAALVKAEKKTTAVAKVDPNRVQFVWDPVTRSMKRVGAAAEESVETKDDAPKTEAAEKNAEMVDKKTADRNSEKSAATDVKMNADATEKNVADAVKTTDAADGLISERTVEKNALSDAEKNQSAVTTKTVDVSSVVAEKGNAAEGKHAIDATAQASDLSKQVVNASEVKTADTTSDQTVEVMTEATETKKTGTHRSKKSASAKKESDASEKPEKKAETTASASKKTAKKTSAKKSTDKSVKTDSKKESAEQKVDADSNKKSADHIADTDSDKKAVKKDSSENGKPEKSPKKVAEDLSSDTKDAQPVLEMTEEDIQLTKKKYSEGINTLHTYYVRLMKAFGREQGRAIYESTKKSVQEDIKARKAQIAAQNAQLTTTEAEEN